MTGVHGLILAKASRASSRVHSKRRVSENVRHSWQIVRHQSLDSDTKNFKPLPLTHVKSNTGGLAGFLSGVIYG